MYVDELRVIVNEVLDENENMVIQYKNGKNLFNFFVGQVMKKTSGQANPALANKIMKEEIDKR